MFHVFPDEWNNNKDLIKSMILSRLKKSKITIGARKCIIKEINVKEANNFFDRTHISKGTKAFKAFGLFYNDILISACSIRRPFQIKKYGYNTFEIARFSVELYHNIPGGFSKLLKQIIKWCNQNNVNNLISYCDLRFGTGNVYIKSGFNLIKENTGINYWYTDGIQKFNRFKFRAQNGMSEKEVAKENGVYKIYGCGNSLYKLTI